MSAPILSVQDLRVYYYTEAGAVRAVDGVTLDVARGMRMGLVGESGCGKSTMAMAFMRLIKAPGRIESGSIVLDGVDLVPLSEEQMRQTRLSQISMIPQGAMNSLNPVARVRDQIIDGIKDHDGQFTKAELNDRVQEVLEAVDLRPEVAKQRVCIALAMSLRPSLIIADELTSALDVVVQRQVMETLRDVQADIGASVILVGHDMGLMAQFVERLGVMYAGRLMEVSPVNKIFESPRHPYTQMLISSLPSTKSKGQFTGIPGLPPSLLDVPSGCVFHPRCPLATDRCRVEVPALRELQPDLWVSCHLAS